MDKSQVVGSHASEIMKGDRFRFGDNWYNYLKSIDENAIEMAKQSLISMLGTSDLSGKKFLDAGSGSGLFSLAARMLGATVYSFDFDPSSVKSTRYLKDKFYKGDQRWTVEEGSLLNRQYMDELGAYDVVYSWGVMHHTGDMLAAFQNIFRTVRADGKLFIAIYNDQGVISDYWKHVKRLYNKNVVLKALIIILHFPYLVGFRLLVRMLLRKGGLERGMSYWNDMLDWLGGYPFEVAKPEVVFDFYKEKGMALDRLVTTGGRMGCNEYVFSLNRRNRHI